MKRLLCSICVLILLGFVTVSFHKCRKPDEYVSQPTEFIELTELTEDETDPTEQPETIEPIDTIETTVATEPVEQTEPPQKYSDDGNYSGFVGRLYIPDVGIDVALYSGYSQSITDREDSANIFRWKSYYGEVIADHSNQDFSELLDVSVGSEGRIELKDGSVVIIKCVAVFNGHNTGQELTDEVRNNIIGQADYVMYTCVNGWQNVRICLWNKTE